MASSVTPQRASILSAHGNIHHSQASDIIWHANEWKYFHAGWLT